MKKINYDWIIVFFGMLCIFGCICIAFFGLDLLLPAMAKSLKLNYSMMGEISIPNFSAIFFVFLRAKNELDVSTPIGYQFGAFSFNGSLLWSA